MSIPAVLLSDSYNGSMLQGENTEQRNRLKNIDATVAQVDFQVILVGKDACGVFFFIDSISYDFGCCINT